MKITHIANRDSVAFYNEKYVVAKYIIVALICSYNFSLFVYLHPLLIGSSNLRLLIADGSAILFAIWLWNYLGCTLWRAGRNPALSLLLAFMVALSFISLFQGLTSLQIAKIDVVREFRVFFYFMLMLLIWLCRNTTPGTQHEWRASTLIIIIMLSSIFGGLLYIIVGNILAPTPKLYNQLIATYGDAGRGLGLAAQQKFKITPYACAVLQSWLMFQVVIGRRNKVTHMVIIVLIVLNTYVALQSNMRSALGAFVAATIVPYVYAFRSVDRLRRITTRTMLSFPIIVPVLTIIAFVYGGVLINERFTDQVANKGVNSADIATRVEVLMGLFDLSAMEKFSALGEGMGAGFTDALWGGILNPIDSAFFNVFLTMGVVALSTYLLIMIVAAYNSWLIWQKSRLTTNQTITELSIAAGVLIFIVNGFNDSQFLFVPDAIIAGSIVGYISSAARQAGLRSFPYTRK